MLAIYPLFGQKRIKKDTSYVKKDLDTLSVGESKSGYDDIVARQLREAAEKENDPELKKKLWEEYRKYKKGS